MYKRQPAGGVRRRLQKFSHDFSLYHCNRLSAQRLSEKISGIDESGKVKLFCTHTYRNFHLRSGFLPLHFYNCLLYTSYNAVQIKLRNHHGSGTVWNQSDQSSHSFSHNRNVGKNLRKPVFTDKMNCAADCKGYDENKEENLQCMPCLLYTSRCV